MSRTPTSSALQFSVLQFDEEDARQAGQIRAHLASNGTPIGSCEVLIAGQPRLPSLHGALVLVEPRAAEYLV
jgi:hypothetical protein